MQKLGIALLLVAALGVAHAALTCDFQVGGKNYGIGCLFKEGGYAFDMGGAACPGAAMTVDWPYWLQLCGEVDHMGCPMGTACCQNDGTGFVSCGQADQVAASPLSTGGEGFSLMYTGGTPTTDTKMPRKMKIDFICAEKETPLCFMADKAGEYDFQYTGPKACADSCGGSGGGFSGGWIFITILLVGTFLYCVIGAAYQFKFKEARGADMMPNKEFWFDLPSLIKDGCMFVVNKIRGGGGSYTAI